MGAFSTCAATLPRAVGKDPEYGPQNLYPLQWSTASGLGMSEKRVPMMLSGSPFENSRDFSVGLGYSQVALPWPASACSVTRMKRGLYWTFQDYECV
ncbi:hypothetical protein GN956_G2500 [Arapaima gigas]